MGEPTKRMKARFDGADTNQMVSRRHWSVAVSLLSAPEVGALRAALLGAEQVFTTELVLQEVMQCYAGPKNRDELVERLSVLAVHQPDKKDHIAAADIRNACRRRGVQIGTIDPCSSRSASATT
jgi:predicted nucleic acid-binding protein